MNTSLLILDMAVAFLALGILLADLWAPPAWKRLWGWVGAAGCVVILVGSTGMSAPSPRYAFGELYVLDNLALFFKRFFLLGGALVLTMTPQFVTRLQSGWAEFVSLMLFALCGMLFAASANDFTLMFVALELVTVTFYVLTSFQRNRLASLEAGVKYLIIGALSTAFTVYGIALIFGMTGRTSFTAILALGPEMASKPIFVAGVLLVMVGLAFKLAAFPFHLWAPDVYQGSPTPITAFLAIGSKAVGVVLLLRLLFVAAPGVAAKWSFLLMTMATVTILYGNLCAIPQRNLKRLLGYSSIAQAGYLLLGFTAMNAAGSAAILYYLSGYLFATMAAFLVIAIVMRDGDGEDISTLSGLHRRSPILALGLALAMISLAGIPPLAGFFGKFLIFKALLQKAGLQPAYYVVTGLALFGIVISFYYYLGVVKAIYWPGTETKSDPISLSWPVRGALVLCMAGMLYLGINPDGLLQTAHLAARDLPGAPASKAPLAGGPAVVVPQ